MSEFAEFLLADGGAVRIELADVGDALAVAAEGSQELAEGIGGVAPISRGRRPALLTGEALEAVLRPLSPLLRHIHDAVVSDVGPHRPEVVTAEFGVQIGQDFKLGVVGASGQVSLKISATWRLEAGESGGAKSGGAKSEGAKPEGAKPAGAKPAGAESAGAEAEEIEPEGAGPAAPDLR